jgi:hypothetical protein
LLLKQGVQPVFFKPGNENSFVVKLKKPLPMKKPIISLVTGLFAAFSLFAQTSNFQHGKFNFSAGIGLVPTFVSDATNVNMPPVSLRIGYQVARNFNISAFGGYSSYELASPYLISDGKLATLSNQQFLAGLRGEVRRDFSEKFDVYGGGMLGYSHASTREFNPQTGEKIVRPAKTPTPYDPNGPENGLLYAGFIGSTFYLKQGIGFFAEIGYGVSLVNTGITVRL